jgi:GNAT superfamily N-acetyltransferase
VTALKIKTFQAEQETTIANIHNAANAVWAERLDPCFRYRPITPDAFIPTPDGRANIIKVAHLRTQTVGYASATLNDQDGFLALHFDISHPNWGQSRIAVLPEYQGQGIATRLVQAVLDDFRARGGAIAVAWAYNFNAPACALFTKAGFLHQPLFYYPPYSENEPWGFDSIFAEINLIKSIKNLPQVPDLTIRAPAPGDMEAFIDLYRRSAPFAFGLNPTHQQIEEWLSNLNSAAILVGVFEGKVIGAMEYFHDSVIGIPGILPEYRNRGFGTTLFYHLLQHMKDNGHSKAVGDTGIIQKEMLRLYRRFGFDLSKRLFNWVKVL